MNKKVILSWLSLLILLVASVHVPVASAANTISSGSAAPAMANDLDDSDDPDDPDETPTPEPPLDSPPTTPMLPTQTKPTILDPSNWSPPKPLQPILAYTFPSGISNWTIPVRAAAFVEITPDPSERFTPVGMVEIGANPETESESRLYLVAIDLTSREPRVRGQLVLMTPPDVDISSVPAADTVDVVFLRIPQRLNPDRMNSPYEAFQGLPPPSDSMATIFADGVCFDVKVANGTGNDDDNDSDDDSDNGNHDDANANSSVNDSPIYNIYCSKPDLADLPEAPLSVMDNFPSQYAELQSMISEIATPFDLENRIQMDEVISTIESIEGIQECASLLTEEACGSDVIAAPVTEQYFEQQFKEAFGGNGDGDGGDDDDRDDNDRDDDNGDDDDEDDNNGENGKNGDTQSQTLSMDTAGANITSNDDDRDDDDRNDNGDDDRDGDDRDDDDSGDDDDRDGDDRDDDDNGDDDDKPGPPTSIEVAVVRVLQPIETPDSTVQPGDYVMHWWFDSNAVFYAVTLTGVTTDNTQVTNQQIPGVPASFIEKRSEGPKEPASQISAWKVKVNAFGRQFQVCCWWEGC